MESLDAIQQEIFQYCNQIVPRYIPKMEVVDYQNKGIYYRYDSSRLLGGFRGDVSMISFLMKESECMEKECPTNWKYNVNKNELIF